MAVKFNFTRLGQPFEADWPVKVSVPADGGKTNEEEFTARFRLLSKEATEEAVKVADENEYFRRFFVGFGQGEEAVLTPELFDQMMEPPYVRQALLRAYQSFAAGIAVKN